MTTDATSVFSGIAVRFGIPAECGLRATRHAVKEALPAYLASGAPIHRNHGGEQVGRVLKHELTDSELRIEFEVTDADTRHLVASGTYTALSMGFKFNRKRDVVGGALMGLDLEEFSVGRVPSVPGCRIST